MINEYKILSFFGITKDMIFPESAGLTKDDERLMEEYLFKQVNSFVKNKISFKELKNEFFPNLNIEPSMDNYIEINNYIKSL